jgi:hypothetical protein
VTSESAWNIQRCDPTGPLALAGSGRLAIVTMRGAALPVLEKLEGGKCHWQCAVAATIALRLVAWTGL